MPTGTGPRRISPRLLDTLKKAKEHGRLVRAGDDTWSHPGVAFAPDGKPEWWVTPGIVNALRTTGLLEITRTGLKTGQWIEAEITPAGLAMVGREDTPAEGPA